MDYAANLAMFLQEKTGTVCGRWNGHMSAKDQRELFGRFLGKGMIHIDGAKESLKMTVKVCFGLDFDVRAELAWRDL